MSPAVSSIERYVGRLAAAAVTVAVVVWGRDPAAVVTVVAVEPNRTDVAAKPNRTDVAAEPNGTLGVAVPAAGVDVEVEDGVEVVLGVLEEAVLVVGCMGTPMGGFSKVPVEIVKLGFWALF